MGLDWTLYWFMFPVGIAVATTAMLSGIAGAALLGPFFLLVFPLLGPEYVLAEPTAAISVAVLSAIFGFSSGFIGYYRKGLIHFASALPFVAISVPFAILGGFILVRIGRHDALMYGIYASFMIALTFILFNRARMTKNMNAVERMRSDKHTLVARDGKVYQFFAFRFDARGTLWTGLGGFLTGLLGIGIGEAVMPQFLTRLRMAMPVAAATSVVVVIVTNVCAFVAQFIALSSVNAAVIPWNLLCYILPGVLIGGQIGPRLQEKIPQALMERAMAVLFALISIAMTYIAWKAA